MSYPVVMSGAFVVWLVFGKPPVCDVWCDFPEAGVWPLVVVDLDKLIDEVLKFSDGKYALVMCAAAGTAVGTLRRPQPDSGRRVGLPTTATCRTRLRPRRGFGPRQQQR